MQSSWLGVLLMAAVVVVGFVVSMVLIKDRVQRKAITGAFVSLVLLVVLFFSLVIMLKLNVLLPILAIVCIVLPVVVYGTILWRTSGKIPEDMRKKELSVAAMKIPSRKTTGGNVIEASSTPALKRNASSMVKAKTSIRSQVAYKDGSPPQVRKASVQEPLQNPVKPQVQSQEQTQQLPTKPQVQLPLEPKMQVQPDIAVTLKKVLQASEKLQDQNPEFVDTKDVSRVSTSTTQGAPSPKASKPQTPQTPQVDSVGQIFIEDSTASSLEVFKKTSETKNLAKASTDIEAHKEASPKDTTAFKACFEKAEAFKERGMFTLAARLYSECARIASEPAEEHKAFFAEMAVHVKNDNIARAKQLALSLQKDVKDLNPLEVVKLDAVLRMP